MWRVVPALWVRAADSMRVITAIRAHRLALHTTARPLAGAEADLAHVPPEPQGGDRGHGLLHGADSDLPRPVRLVRNQALEAPDRALERHGESDGTVGGAAAAGGVPLRYAANGSSYLVFDRDA